MFSSTCITRVSGGWLQSSNTLRHRSTEQERGGEHGFLVQRREGWRADIQRGRSRQIDSSGEPLVRFIRVRGKGDHEDGRGTSEIGDRSLGSRGRWGVQMQGGLQKQPDKESEGQPHGDR